MKDQMNILAQANQARLDELYEDVIHLYTRYLTDYNNDVDVMWILAQTLYEQAFRKTDQMIDRLEDATNWIKKAIDSQPERPEFYVTLGKILTTGVNAPDYKQAADCYRKALKLSPTFFSAGVGLAFLVNVPESSVNLSEAIAIMEKIAEVRLDDQHVFMSLGYLYEKAKYTDASQAMFKRAILCSDPLAIRQAESIAEPRNVQIALNMA